MVRQLQIKLVMVGQDLLLLFQELLLTTQVVVEVEDITIILILI